MGRQHKLHALRSFIAGLAFPAVAMPLVMGIAFHSGFARAPASTMNTIFHVMLLAPIIWGLWNVLYFYVEPVMPAKKRTTRLWLTGGSLGLLVAMAIIYMDMPGLFFDLQSYGRFMPLLIVPLVYGFIWRHIVHYLNEALGLKYG